MSKSTSINPEDAVFFLPGNHLYPVQHLRAFKTVPILMVEDQSVCQRRPYHQQKLALLLGAMREHAQLMREKDFVVDYHTLDQANSITEALTTYCKKQKVKTLITFTITDSALSAVLEALCKNLNLAWEDAGDPGFLTSQTDFRRYAEKNKSLHMAHFYKQQRKDLDLLIGSDGKPEGGQWSFDADNRKRFPKRGTPPELNWPKHSDTTKNVIQLIEQEFSDHPGKAENLWLPTTRRGALQWLNQFLEERLIGFGTYEDAITTRSATLFHSTLSPLINLGLLTPTEVIERTRQYAEQHDVPINDLEGFIRQVIGWREFIRGVYVCEGKRMSKSNARNATRHLTHHWHDATTGIPPLDLAIKHQLELGWNHHINRLMVLANLMNLCEIEPQSVYEYFMTYYIDAYDWVMVPNVYGMGLTSDGGVFATKPYICGSNYLLKMSDIKKGDWCDVVDGLYWRFVANNRKELSANPRLAAFASGIDRLDGERKQRIFSAADAFLKRCTE